MSVSEATFFGTARDISFGSDLTLKRAGARVLNLTPTTGSLAVILPDARLLKIGGPHWILHNDSATPFNLEDNLGTILGTLAEDDVGVVYLIDNSTQAGVWGAKLSTLVGGGNLGFKSLASTLTGATMFMGDLDVRTIIEMAATLTGATAFSGQITEDTTKEMAGTLTGATAFTADITPVLNANIVSPTATGGGDGSFADPWTLREAATQATPGETFYLRGGTYGTGSSHVIDSTAYAVANGTSGNNIIYTNYPNELPVMRGIFKLQNVQYMVFRGLRFHSTDGKRVVDIPTSGTQRDLQWIGCSFHADNPIDVGDFSGVLIRSGLNYYFANCVFEDWPNGDQLRIDDSSQITIENCDFTKARADHANMNLVEVSNISIRRCCFRNPWDRAIEIRRRDAAITALVEECVFFDCEWNRIDPHPRDGLPTAFERGNEGVMRFSVNRGIFRNNILVGSNRGKDFAYSGSLQIALFSDFNEADDAKFYHNVIHRSQKSGFSTYRNNAIAGTTLTRGVKFLNNSVSESVEFAFLIYNSDIEWSDWLVANNRFSDTAKTTTIHLEGEVQEDLTIAQAQANHGSVFKSNIGAVPDFMDESIFDDIDADPTLFLQADIETYFDKFTENGGAAGRDAGRELATVTAGGTGTTITVDDAYMFWPGNNFSDGDSIIIGSNSPVEVTAINSKTSLTVDTSITVSTNDKIYLEKTGTTPDIGLYPLSLTPEQLLAGTFTGASAFTSAVRYDALTLAGTSTAATAFTGDMTTEPNNLVDIDIETGNLSQFDSTVTDSGDLSATGAAALNGTSFGMSCLIDDTNIIYGRKALAWTAQVLRARFYMDPNSLTMAASDDFYMLHFSRDTGFSNGYVRLTFDGSNYKVYAAWRDDGAVHLKTGEYVISDAPHYIEIALRYSTNSTSLDGELELLIDGVQKELRQDLDLWDRAKSQRVDFGIPLFPAGAGTSGTLYLDELIVREIDVAIGA